MMSVPKAIREWLAEYKTLPDNELNTYASTIRQNEELVASLYSFFESQPPVESLDPVCHQLFEFYRSSETGLKMFSMEFIPTLIWLYLSSLSVSGRKCCGGVEAFLLGLYNLEIVTEKGLPKVKTFRIPSFAQPSVYHEPGIITSLSLTESALSRLNQTETGSWRGGPFPQYESINGQNRQTILAYILQAYMADISSLSPLSHKMFCKACSRIATTGFTNLSDITRDETSFHLPGSPRGGRPRSQIGELPPRITLSPAMMIEMLSGLYYVTFNTQPLKGTRAIYDLHHRASYELYADVLIVTNAMTNSLQAVPGHLEERLKGMMSVTPSSSGHAISKSAITNASFRAKKLPDDISIVQDEETATAQKLMTIEEDGHVGDTSATAKTGTKTSRFNLVKALKETRKAKESKKDSSENMPRGNLMNGESTDGVQVGVIKNSSRMIVDSVEMQPFSRKHADLDHSGSDEKGSGSPVVGGKHKSGMSMKEVMELKGKSGHNRHSSGSSVNSESYSTNL